jgi:hypothetical protein
LLAGTSAFNGGGLKGGTMVARWLVRAAVMLFLSLDASAEDRPVDLALVLAADVSHSISHEELELQREGYADALLSPPVLGAIREGPYGRIAVTYVEWSGEGAASVGVNWTTVDGIAAMKEVADQIRSFVPGAPKGRRAGRTSISYALRFSVSLFDRLQRPAGRRVIDISGDGVNNDGESLATARGPALQAGVTINGLAIGDDVTDGETITDYYAREVIAGPDSFVEPAASLRDFQVALERKLWREIAGDTARATPFAYGPPPTIAHHQRVSITGPAMGGEGLRDPRVSSGGDPPPT